MDRRHDTTRVALEPITDRSHQLRVHLLAQGHPIVGDALYDAPDQAPRLMLHACTLALRHPVTDAPFVSTRNQFLFTLLESTPYPGGGFVNPDGGDGYQRIAAALREAGIEPATTRNDINTFTMTITKQRTMANSSPGDVVKAIMTVLERHSAMSVKEIMRELQLTPLAATSGMRELMKEGRVARVKFADDPAQRYRLKG